MRYVTGQADEGRLLGDVLREKMGLTRREIGRAKFAGGGIHLDGVQRRVDYRVREGEHIEVRLTDREGGSLIPAAGPLSVVYEDTDCIVVDKPRGLLVHPAGVHYTDTLANRLAAYFLEKREPASVCTVGRLDKDTAGLMLFGKNRAAAARLAAQKENGLCKKTYLAWVEGVPSPAAGSITAPIRKIADSPLIMEAGNGGKPAVTHYEVLRAQGDKSLIRAEIETGRTHQIRVHMACIGHPLLDDPIYNPAVREGQEKAPGERPHYAALCAWRLTFRQPFSGEAVTVTSGETPDFHS